MMKKILLALVSLVGWLNAQTPPTIDPNTCMTQQNLYTSTTDPSDAGTYQFGYYNLNPNGVNGPTHLDWINTTLFPCYTTQNQAANSPTYFRSPFYCNGSTGVNGACDDDNTALYNNINNDPFNQYSNTAAKLKAMDILPEDGWELIKYSFGRPVNTSVPGDQGVAEYNPYLWLYNRFTGKMKLYVAVTNLNMQTGANPSAAIIKITSDPVGQYDLFANAKPFTHILSAFDHQTDVNAVTNCDLVSLNAASSGLQYYWLYSEFVTSYDPCVCRQANSNITKLRFDVILTQVASVNLTMDGTAYSAIYNGSGNALNPSTGSVNGYKIDDNAGSSVGSQLISSGKEAVKGYKDWKEYAENIKNYFNSVTSNGTTPPPSNNSQVMNIITTVASSQGFGSSSSVVQTNVAYDFINGTNTYGHNPSPKPASEAVQILSGLAPLVEDLASAAPYIGAFIALTNSLFDAGSNESKTLPSTQPAAPPTTYALNAKISGSIEYSSTLNHASVFMPGEYLNKDMSVTGQTNADGLFPIYNNPLGVFSIIDVPDFEYKTIPITDLGVDGNDPNLGYGYIASKDFNQTTNSGGSKLPFSNVYDYKLSGDVKYALNPASNLSVKSIDASIVLEYNGTDPLFIKHNSICITSQLSIAQGNPAGFTGYSSGNNGQKQIPYYPEMHSELIPYDPSYSSPYFFSDVLSVITSAYKNEMLDVEEASSNYTKSDGTNGANEYIRLRTKYVPLQSLKNIDFILLGNQGNLPKVYLKLFCKFSKNNDPNAEPVTMVLTYDISDKLNNNTSNNTGSGGYGHFNYYYIKNFGSPYSTQKPGDYAAFSHLFVGSAYYSPQYGSPGPINISSTTSGAISTGNINVSNGITLPGNNTGFLTYSAITDFNIGDDVELATTPAYTPQHVAIRAGNNINIGKGFYTNSFSGAGHDVTLSAGNDINISDSYILGLIGSGVNFNAGHAISLNNSSPHFNLYSTTTGDSYIEDSKLLATNEIAVHNTSSNNDTHIVGESVLSTKATVPNIWVVLDNGDAQTPITNNAASNSDIAGLCSANNNRMASPQRGTETISTPMVKLSNASTKIGIYPNPTNGVLNVNVALDAPGQIILTVESITGQQITRQELPTSERSSTQIDLHKFDDGIYILKVLDENGNLLRTEKVILNR